MDFWFAAWLLLVAAALVQAGLLALQTFEHRRFARSRLTKPANEAMHARIALFAPCKGFDLELEQNLRPLLEQDYPNYEVTFIVESADDPAAQTIRQLIAAQGGGRARLLVAGKATDTGQKVHNLLAATSELAPDVELVAFVDSDARPRPQWLRLLVQRLDRPGAGAATGYRWFIPQRPTLANHLLYGINAAAAVLVGPGKRRLVWGGSWAIRRDVLISSGLRTSWQRTLSDDLVAARVLSLARQHVEFEPACMLASPLDNSLVQTFLFARRQYVIGRFYSPGFWLLGLAAVAGWNIAFWTSAVALLQGVADGGAGAIVPATACLALWGANVVRGLFRRDLALLYFPEHRAAIRAASRLDIWASPLIALVNCVALVSSAFGKHLTWRGITYRLRRGGRVRIVARQELPPPADAQEAFDAVEPPRPVLSREGSGFQTADNPAHPRRIDAGVAAAAQSPKHLAPRFTAAQDRKD
jgi:ceramide glucosyltransferase